MTSPIHSYKQLLVWQRAIQLSIEMYRSTADFPKSEQFGLTSQMRRAAVSVSANIAEGRHRGSRAEFIHFLNIAFGSANELESHCEIAKHLFPGKITPNAMSLLEEVLRMLNTMIIRMKAGS